MSRLVSLLITNLALFAGAGEPGGVRNGQPPPARADDHELENMIHRDDADALRRQLDMGLSVNYKTSREFSLLHWAVWRHAAKCMDLLIKRGADVDLISAAAVGDVERARGLLNDDPGAVVRRIRGYQPLHFAASYGHSDTISLLVENGADVQADAATGTPLQISIRAGHPDAVRELLKYGASLEGAAHHARSAAMLKLLLDLGANPDDESEGISLIAVAAMVPDIERVQLLISHDIPEPQLNQALHACAMAEDRAGSIETLEVLLAAGATVSAKSGTGGTVLHTAAESESLKVCEFFLKLGIDVNARDKQGRTALHYAALGLDKRISDLLVRYGADWNARDNRGMTPADYRD